jgi:hypothetical protein
MCRIPRTVPKYTKCVGKLQKTSKHHCLSERNSQGEAEQDAKIHIEEPSLDVALVLSLIFVCELT